MQKKGVITEGTAWQLASNSSWWAAKYSLSFGRSCLRNTSQTAPACDPSKLLAFACSQCEVASLHFCSPTIRSKYGTGVWSFTCVLVPLAIFSAPLDDGLLGHWLCTSTACINMWTYKMRPVALAIWYFKQLPVRIFKLFSKSTYEKQRLTSNNH